MMYQIYLRKENTKIATVSQDILCVHNQTLPLSSTYGDAKSCSWPTATQSALTLM